jgi:transcriptional regulator with GAF, ATPase, and Fis domain
MPVPDRGFDLLDDTVESVEGAADVDEALANMARVLLPRFGMTAATVTLFEGESLRIAALWETAPGVFAKGMSVSTNFTDDTRAVALHLRETGSPLMLHAEAADLGLVGDLISEQGLRAGVLIPLWEGEDVVGVLTFAGPDVEPFADHAVPLFTGIGRGVEDRILKLAGAR